MIGWLRNLFGTKKETPRLPGEVLDEEFLIPGGFEDHEFAAILGITDDQMDDLLLGQTKIDQSLAEKLGRTIRQTDANYWLTLQHQYDAWRETMMNKELP